MLGFLRAAHARGAALGRLWPSELRVTASCVVLMDPAAAIPVDEEELYAPPEELFARPQPAAADATVMAGGSAHGSRSGGGGSVGGSFRSASGGSVGGSGGSLDNLVGAVPAAGATGGRLASGALPLQGSLQPPPQRTPSGDMFSLGLLLLQLLHPLSGGSSAAASSPAAGLEADAGGALAAAEQARRTLRDARHQILPSALLQACCRDTYHDIPQCGATVRCRIALVLHW